MWWHCYHKAVHLADLSDCSQRLCLQSAAIFVNAPVGTSRPFDICLTSNCWAAEVQSVMPPALFSCTECDILLNHDGHVCLLLVLPFIFAEHGFFSSEAFTGLLTFLQMHTKQTMCPTEHQTSIDIFFYSINKVGASYLALKKTLVSVQLSW